MKNPDPYTVLGVPKNAPPEVIRRAHRQRAKSSHKDKGGNDDDMRAVNEAWMVLRDPDRRQRYDETGETEQRDQTVNRLVGLFLRACEAGVEDPRTNPIDLTRQKLRNMRSSVEASREEFTKLAARHLKTAGRIKRKGQNLLKSVLENHAAGLNQKAKACQTELDDIDKMMELLEGYEFEGEPVAFTTGKPNGRQQSIEEFAEMLRQFGI